MQMLHRLCHRLLSGLDATSCREVEVHDVFAETRAAGRRVSCSLVAPPPIAGHTLSTTPTRKLLCRNNQCCGRRARAEPGLVGSVSQLAI